MANYIIERDGQIDFFDNYGIPYNDDNSILIDNTDGVYNGNILEFKLDISNLNKVLFQAIKYLSRMRVKGEDVPATILLIDLNDEKVYQYRSSDYKDAIHKIYIGAASKDNRGFTAGKPNAVYDYSKSNPDYMVASSAIKRQLKGKKKLSDLIMPIDIDENCIVGWAERYYREVPNATKGDFLGDDTGSAVSVTGEIRNPRHFAGRINPYSGKSNEKFKYLMDCLNDRLSKKDLGAFYTPIPYAKKASELVEMAVQRALDAGKTDYIILDRCAGTGNLESALIGLTDINGDDLISHCIVSTYEYYEYKVLNERIGDLVRDIIPPTEADVVYANGKVSNADAMSEDFINNPIIKHYIDDEDCAVILFENPPYRDAGASDVENTNGFRNFINSEMCKETLANKTVAYDLANMFIWSGYKYYLRQNTDSYILFSPIKYWKMHQLSAKKCIDGFIFNRNHFHATASAIFCILWSNENDTNEILSLKAFDIVNDSAVEIEQSPIKCKKVHQMSNKYLPSTKSFSGVNGIVCGLDGVEIAKKSRGTALYNPDYFAYIRLNGFNLDALNRTLTTVMPYPAMGRYLTKNNYLSLIPLFVAKMFQEEQWYERDIYATTSDGGDTYTKDKDFLKSCLIYTCLSNQNKCLTFDGSDGRHYQNELCFDQDTIASNDLSGMSLDADEQALIKLWNNILTEARATGKCNPNWTYGVYQITKEINTFQTVGTGKSKKNIYDYPQLNGDLDTLRTMLKAYYKSHITKKMFQYELLK